MYSPSKTILKRMPSWVMGTGQRKSLCETENTPGPGNYTLKPKITEGPKYVMGLKGASLNKE
jgi:hypothetical protein